MVEPLNNGHHWEPTICPLQRGVPNSGASGIFPVGILLRNRAVEHNVDTFPELSPGREGKAKASINASLVSNW